MENKKLTRYDIGQCLRLLEGPPGYYVIVGVMAGDMYHIESLHRVQYTTDYDRFVAHNIILPVSNPLIYYP
jgi:hypothetical protein